MGWVRKKIMAETTLSELPRVDIGVAPKVANVVVPPPTQLGNNPASPPMKQPDPAPEFSNATIENTINRNYSQNNDDAQKALGVINKTLINPTPENKLEFAKHIEEKNALDKTGHINTQTQWGPVIASVLKGDYMGALKYYNGGPTRTEEAYSPIYGRAYKEFNSLGATGKIYNALTGKEIPPDVLNEIGQKGGYFQSKSDTSALQDPRYSAASDLVKKAMTGIPSALMDQTALAQQMAGTMSQVADGATQLKKLVMKKDNGFLDNFSKLDPKQREDFLSLTNEYFGTNKNATSAQALGANGSVNAQTGATAGINAGIGGGLGKTPGTPATGNNPAIPGSSGANLDISGNLGTSAANSVTNSANATANATKAVGESGQTQKSLQDRISGYLGGQPLNPQQFQDLQKYLATYQTLSATHDALVKNNLLAPGSVAISAPDPRISGRENAFVFANDTAKNAALASAYANYKAHLMNINAGQLPPAEDIINGFLDSKTFETIDKHFKQNHINYKTNAKEVKHSVGDIALDPLTNRPIKLNANGKWEHYSE